MRARSSLTAAAVAATAVLVALSSGAQAQPAAPGPALDRPLRGVQALDALGDRLPAVAALNGRSEADLRARMRKDRTLWLDRDGRLHVKDDHTAAATTRVEPAAAPFPTASTFALHSKPGSRRVIHLDFDGQTVSGTAWNTDYGVSTARQPGLDLDGNPGAWSQAEHDLVQSVYLRVAEDFAPFDVDVTTQDPGTAALDRSSEADLSYGTRVLITPSTSAQDSICPEGCGGVAYVGTFNIVAGGEYRPAWVFAHQLGLDAKNIAEAASHEAGHTLGLEHDGTATTSYYAGHGSWAPIMGAGYSRPVVQWSRGEYPGADNRQDDLAVMQQYGLALRGDDHGSSTATARALGTTLSATGVLEKRTDKDVFAITRDCTSTLGVRVSPAPVSPDADLRVRLLRGDGTVLDEDDPLVSRTSSDVAAGLSASVSAATTPGTYFVEVDGVGAGSLTTGSSDYGSLGAYGVTVGGCPGSRTVTLAPVADSAARQQAPAVASGAATSLVSDAQETSGTSSRSTAYLRFTVPALAAGETVTAARLSLQVSNATSNGPKVWRTASRWDESAMTWASGQPSRSGTAAAGDFGAMAVGRASTAVSGVSGAGQVSLQLHADGTDGLGFASREHATVANRPQLVLTVTRGG